MNIGFIAPQSIAVVNGGVRTQALMTANELKKIGVNISFISPWERIEGLDIDLFHVFSAGIENTGIINRLSETGKKIALSPVMFSNRSSDFIRRLMKWESKLHKFSAGIRSEFAIKKLSCLKADRLLPNTYSEAKLISEAFGIDDSKLIVVPNGVEERFKNSSPDFFTNKTNLKDFILFAGQASAPRKNVLSLLKAVEKIDTDLVLIGDFDDSEYSSKCLKLANKMDHVHLFNTQQHDSELLSSAYAACKTFVLPSQFETPGIAAMEASLAGANIVITRCGGTTNYFENFVDYVDPKSVDSIRKGVISSLNKNKSNQLKQHILDNFLWKKTAEQTLKAYNQILS